MLTKEDLEAIERLITNAISPLKQELDTLSNDMVSVKTSISTLSDDMVSVKTSIATLSDDMVSVKTSIGTLSDDMVSVKTRLGVLSDDMKNVQNYLKIDSTGIEEEINETIEPYLERRFQGFTVKKLELKTLSSPTSNEVLTELDGGYILISRPTITRSGSIPEQRYIVIVEAKHYVTFSRINYKFEQIALIKRYINEAKKYAAGDENADWTKRFKSHVKQYGFDKVDHIYFFIGGPMWEQGTIKYMKKIDLGSVNISDQTRLQLHKISKEEFQDTLTYMRGFVGTIVPKGSRYYVDNAISQLHVGGGTGTSKTKINRWGAEMRILTNHMNHTFT